MDAGRVALERSPRDVRGAGSQALVPLALGRGHAGEEGAAGRVGARRLEPAVDGPHRHLRARRRAVTARARRQRLGGERDGRRWQVVRLAEDDRGEGRHDRRRLHLRDGRGEEDHHALVHEPQQLGHVDPVAAVVLHERAVRRLLDRPAEGVVRAPFRVLGHARAEVALAGGRGEDGVGPQRRVPAHHVGERRVEAAVAPQRPVRRAGLLDAAEDRAPVLAAAVAVRDAGRVPARGLVAGLGHAGRLQHAARRAPSRSPCRSPSR